MPKLHAPAALRNCEPILAVLRRVLAETLAAEGARTAVARARVLEIASGSGEHARAFAAALAALEWQPSDPDANARASIEAHRNEAGLSNLRAPLVIDVCDPRWEEVAREAPLAAIVCINMLHIAPWRAAEGLFRGAGRLLDASHAALVCYGPFRFEGVFTAPSNAAFDADLRARNPAWGVRDTADLGAEAARAGLALDEVVALPANNHVLVFRALPLHTAQRGGERALRAAP